MCRSPEVDLSFGFVWPHNFSFIYLQLLDGTPPSPHLHTHSHIGEIYHIKYNAFMRWEEAGEPGGNPYRHPSAGSKSESWSYEVSMLPHMENNTFKMRK